MENASKALLIAGSILIAILLIAMGMRLFTSTQGTIDAAEATMQATQSIMYNRDMYSYAGIGQSASKVEEMGQKLIVHNASAKTNSDMIGLYLHFTGHTHNCYGSTNANTIAQTINNLPKNKDFVIQIVRHPGSDKIKYIWVHDGNEFWSDSELLN